MLLVPAFDGVAFAILLLGAVLRGDELGKQRNHPGMPRCHDRRRHQGVIVLDLAIGTFARQAMRAADILRAKILGSVPGHEDSAAQSCKGLAHGRFGKQLLQARKAGLQQRRISPVEHVADVVVGGNFLDPEQRLAVGTAMTLLQAALKRQKRRALHEKHGKGREAEISHGNVAAATLPAVRKGGTNGLQTRNKAGQQLHPNRESFFR